MRERHELICEGMQHEEVVSLFFFDVDQGGQLGHQHTVCGLLDERSQNRHETCLLLLDNLDYSNHEHDAPVCLDLFHLDVFRRHVDDSIHEVVEYG